MSQRAMSDEEAPFTSLHKPLYCDWYNTPIPFVEVSHPMIVGEAVVKPLSSVHMYGYTT